MCNQSIHDHLFKPVKPFKPVKYQCNLPVRDWWRPRDALSYLFSWQGTSYRFPQQKSETAVTQKPDIVNRFAVTETAVTRSAQVPAQIFHSCARDAVRQYEVRKFGSTNQNSGILERWVGGWMVVENSILCLADGGIWPLTAGP